MSSDAEKNGGIAACDRRQGEPSRVFLFRDLSGGCAAALLDALAAVDPAVTYRRVASPEEFETRRDKPAVIIFYAAADMPDMAETLFAEIEACTAMLPESPMALVTDMFDPVFYLQCYRRGLKGVLPVAMLTSNAALALRFMVSGGTFLPPQMIMAGLSPRCR